LWVGKSLGKLSVTRLSTTDAVRVLDPMEKSMRAENGLLPAVESLDAAG